MVSKNFNVCDVPQDRPVETLLFHSDLVENRRELFISVTENVH